MNGCYPEACPSQAVRKDGRVAQRQLALSLTPRHGLHIHHLQQLWQQLHLQPMKWLLRELRMESHSHPIAGQEELQADLHLKRVLSEYVCSREEDRVKL